MQEIAFRLSMQSVRYPPHNSLPIGRTLAFMFELWHPHIPGPEGSPTEPVRFSLCKSETVFRDGQSVSRTITWNLENVG